MFQANALAGLDQIVAPHPAELRIVQNQVAELRSLLHEVHLRQSGHFVVEAMKADEFAQHDPGVVKAERLVEVTGQKKLLYHVLPFLGYNYLNRILGWHPTNYFNGCYAYKA